MEILSFFPPVPVVVQMQCHSIQQVTLLLVYYYSADALSCRCCLAVRLYAHDSTPWVNQRVKGRSYSRRLSIGITNSALDYLIHSSSFFFFWLPFLFICILHSRLYSSSSLFLKEEASTRPTKNDLSLIISRFFLSVYFFFFLNYPLFTVCIIYLDFPCFYYLLNFNFFFPVCTLESIVKTSLL